MRMAYAYEYGKPACINLTNITALANSADKSPIVIFSNDINIPATPERAAEVIEFVETAFLFKCVTENNHHYIFTLFITTEQNGRLEKSSIKLGRNDFDEKVKKIERKTGKNIVVKAQL